MTTWQEFAVAAPRIAAVFLRRHAATGSLCLLGTVRADGYPRISPMEPRIVDGRLWLGGMPDTRKFHDLDRDGRFCLHTATIDTEVTDGDAKLWGVATDVADPDVHRRYAEALYADTGLDLRDRTFDHLYDADLTSASAVEVGGGHLDVTIWKPGGDERVVRKH